MVPETTDDASITTAYRLLWCAVIFDFLAFGIGFEWDKRWHAAHPIEDFFSPPHLFIYTMHLFATITLAYGRGLRLHDGRHLGWALRAHRSSKQLFIAGSLLADRIWRVVVVPTRAGVIGLTMLAGLVMPALTGVVDLALRARIP